MAAMDTNRFPLPLHNMTGPGIIFLKMRPNVVCVHSTVPERARCCGDSVGGFFSARVKSSSKVLLEVISVIMISLKADRSTVYNFESRRTVYPRIESYAVSSF